MRAVAGQHAHVLTGGSRTFELLPRTHLNTRKFLSFPQYITLNYPNYRSSEKKCPGARQVNTRLTLEDLSIWGLLLCPGKMFIQRNQNALSLL
jgi:hypothetical protein